MHITFTAELSVLDLFLKTVHGGHANERILRHCELFLASHFSILSEQKFLEKGSLTKTCQEYVTQSQLWLAGFQLQLASFSLLVGAASALLASASAPSSIRRGLSRCSIWAFFWRGACAHAPWYRSRSVRARTLNSAATRASGVLGGTNHQQWSARSIVLACPRRSLEGLLFATQKTCLRKNQRFFASNKPWIALVPYVRLRDYHRTTVSFCGMQN